MPSQVLSTRLAPHVYDQLRELAERRGTSLAATAADLLTAALADPAQTPPATDGALVSSVRSVLEDVSAPQAVLHREIAVLLARTIERRERGHLSAVKPLQDAISAALKAQRSADQPRDADPMIADLLASLGGPGGLL